MSLPMRGKDLDWARPIDIAFEKPQTIDPSVLADQHATRHFLMRACRECRRYLGLPVLAAPDEKSSEDSKGVAADTEAQRINP